MKKETVLEEIRKNRNHSWYEEVYNRNKNNLSKTALLFRKTKITYGEYFDMVNSYAKSLKQYGVEKGEEVIACVRQTPDYPVLFGAATLTGSVVNFISPEFNEEFLYKIISESNSKVIFCNDWDFERISNVLQKFQIDKKIVILPVERWAKYGNPFKEITDKYFTFDENKFKEATKEFNNLIYVDEFLEEGKKYTGKVNGDCGLDDDVCITYTSGTTKAGFHKGVPQRNESYIIMGRYHDPEVCGIPSMKNTITLAAIGAQSDTTLMTGVSDTLIQGGIVALDPIIDKDYFIYSIKLNDAGLAIASKSYWINAMKNTYTNSDLKGLKLPYLYVPSAGGEGMSAGEEKALNKWLKETQAGTKITHTPISITKMSIGGGDTEHGSIFLTLFRDYYNGLQKIRGIKEPYGMGVYKFVDLAVLRDDGTYCNPMEYGRMVANSPLNLKHYYHNEDATKKFFITDSYGKVWGDLGTYGYIDKAGNVYVKGRIKDKNLDIKPFEIADVISLDTKNIMSCEVVINNTTGEDVYVAHIEPMFNKKVNIEKMLLSAEERCINKFGDKIANKLLFRVRSSEEGFPITPITKRDIVSLEKEPIDEKCIVPSEYYSNKRYAKVLKK